MIILPSVVIKAYTAMTFLFVVDETWNMKHPRPYPKQNYYMMQWEEKDFYTFKIEGEWVLRKYRKTDTELKKTLRDKYWNDSRGN